ncbi:adenosylmethionine decarboxylase [bacterium]|nr:adenosylmethionine decarboxylase [bacterium]
MHKGHHLLIDCRDVPRELCLDDQRLLNAMADAATKAGATVVSQIRYKFGQDSPPGCTAVVMLDESHCSVHTYADAGLVAMDVFTCGSTDPMDVWEHLRASLDLRNATIRMVGRFETADVLEAR